MNDTMIQIFVLYFHRTFLKIDIKIITKYPFYLFEGPNMKLNKQFMVEPGKKLKLDRRDPDNTGPFKSKKAAHAAMEKNLEKLGELQSILYAENKRSVLIVLQGMDAGGKDGTIKHVMGPLNPQSCKVWSFKSPTDEELSHDFLWRIHKQTPRKGEIVIFNRSHYEDVLIARVRHLVDKKVWSKRYTQINNFGNGTLKLITLKNYSAKIIPISLNSSSTLAKTSS
jgi:polyphosphate kinase 2 (PPK2 family)